MISLVITSFRTGPILAQCLASVRRAEQIDEIVIVDNGNLASETAVLDEFVRGGQVRLLRGQGNVGFARGCNVGAAAAVGDVLVFVNPDVVLERDAPSRLAEAVIGARSPVVIGGDLRDHAGRPERGSRRERLTTWRAFVSITGLSRLERWAPLFRDFNRHHDPLPTQATPVSCISGALFAMRKPDFDAIGGLDEGYFLHVEDIDLCRRAQERRWLVLFLPGPHGVHARSTSEVGVRLVSAHKMRGFARYFTKFGNPVERIVARAAGAMLSFNGGRKS